MTKHEAIEILEEVKTLDDSMFAYSQTYNDALDMAIEALKAQEPRVLTWREVIGAALECKPVFIEVKDSEDKEPGDDRWAMVTQYKDSITNGMIRAMSSYVTSEILFQEDYGRKWRCWTIRPTEVQRKVTPWTQTNGL